MTALPMLTPLMVAVLGLATSQVTLRTGTPTPPGEATSVTLEGVVYTDPSGVEELVGLHVVWSVEGELAAAYEPNRDIGELAWRALARLERGDAVRAEPDLERLFETYAALQGPTARAVSEGLLRCRLRRGVQAAALEPWLAWVRQSNPAELRSPLIPALPPVWLDSHATRAVAQDPRTSPTDLASQLGAWYRAGARAEGGLEPRWPDQPPAHPDAVFVSKLVLAQWGGPERSDDAVNTLHRHAIDHAGTWREAWARLAIGRALVRHREPERQRQGMLHLLHVPARFSTTEPYLCGLALALAGDGARAMGEHALAGELESRLRLEFPDHPATQWAETRARRAPNPAANPITPTPIQDSSTPDAR